MPRWFSAVRVTLRSLFRRRRVEEELEEELRYHLEREIAARLNADHAPEEARYAAMRAMGATAKSKEECRDVRGTRWLDELLQDCR